MSLSRDAILAAPDARVVPFDAPEWGGSCFLRVMSGTERDAFEATLQPDASGRKNLANFRARFAVLVLSDEKGNRLFTDADAVAVGRKSAAALDRVIAEGMKLNALSGTEVDALGKPSATGQSDASGSGSP